jgi:hypothetical protein
VNSLLYRSTINPACLSSLATPVRISLYSASTMGRRATATRSQPGCMFGINSSKQAFNRRLVRLRWTAPPTAWLAVTPICSCPDGLGRDINTISGCAYDFPKRRTRLKSVDRVRRNLRFTHNLPVSYGLYRAFPQKTSRAETSLGGSSYQWIRLTWLFIVTVRR